MEQLAYGVVPFFTKENEKLFLLIQHKAGHWSFPKGKPDQGESPLETAVRELAEETGIRRCSFKENASFEETYNILKKGKPVVKKVRFYLAEVSGQEVTLAQDELKDFAWLPYEKAREKITYEESRRILDEVQAHLEASNK